MRKSMWSHRYAQIKDAVLSYKKNPDDKQPRQVVDLRRAIITKATRDSGEPYWVVAGSVTVKLRPETLVDYKKWALVINQSQVDITNMTMSQDRQEERKMEAEAEEDAKKSRLLAGLIKHRSRLNRIFCSHFTNSKASVPLSLPLQQAL